DDPVVAGYGVYNEPWPGWNLDPGFDDLLLFPFFRRVVDALTGTHDGLPCWSGFFMPAVCGYRDLGVDDRRHLMFLDTGLPREILDFPTHLGLPFSSYPNLVLALHAYTHFYTPDKLVFNQNPRDASYPWGGYEQSYVFAEREARAMGAALFVEEFGDNPADDPEILANQLLEQEKNRVGFAFWTWTEKGGGSWCAYGRCRRQPPGLRQADRCRVHYHGLALASPPNRLRQLSLSHFLGHLHHRRLISPPTWHGLIWRTGWEADQPFLAAFARPRT